MITQSQELNENLIKAIKGKLPSDLNIANMLMDTLCIGREATYRRLRGEVPFTLAEAAAICRKLDISLDSMFRAGEDTIAVVNIHTFYANDAMDMYRTVLDSQIHFYEQMAEDDSSQLHIACNSLSSMNSIGYPEITKFILFKWLYQREGLPRGISYKDLEIPDDILLMQRRYSSLVDNVHYGSCIWDHLMFEYIFAELRYFSSIGLICDDSLELIKRGIRQMLDDAEAIAVKGKTRAGKELQFYISNINFDATYGYASGGNTHQALIKICGINLVTSSDMHMYNRMKGWVESLRKFSTLISQSGEMQRITFFNKQRAGLEAL